MAPPRRNTKTSSASPPPSESPKAVDNMSTMVKGLFEEHVELIKRHFSEEIAKQTASFKANFRELKGIVDDLKQSLEFSQAEIADLKSQLAIQRDEIDEKDIRIETLENITAALRSKQTYLENQSRRNNLRANGIPENGYESWDKVEVKLIRVLVEQLNLDYEPEIERAHRVGKTTKPDGSPLDKLRTIVSKFYDWKVKENILHAARKVKPRGIYVSEDLAEDTRLRRKEHIDKLKEAKAQGKTAYFVLDKLVIRNKQVVGLAAAPTGS